MKKIFFIALLFRFTAAGAQDISYNHHLVDTLTSASFWGRGYTKDGMKKAAEFLANEFRSMGVAPLDSSGYFQNFSFSVNTFPGKMKLKLNGKRLTPGVDFIVGAGSPGMRTKAKLEATDSTHFTDASKNIIVALKKKLTWDAEQKVWDKTILEIDQTKFTSTPKKLKLNISNKFVENFAAANVCAMVRGTERPDSFIFITAHYDHLGGMGKKTYFPGANDNASGTALLMSLAKYYAVHPQRYSIGFILFAAEEAGLVGSKYFTEHPLVPLKHIRFLTNTDLAGTGEEGITIVNATVFPDEFALISNINDENKYLVSIGARGKAANSDHYWFTEKGIPSFFFYTRGGVSNYHDVYDKAATLPLSKQAELMQLLIKFNSALQK